MTEPNPKKLAELEALLFQYGEPMATKKIAKFLAVKDDACQEFIDQLEKILKESEERGLTLLREKQNIQLVTKPELENLNEQLIKEEFREELTPAALETLSIIAYLGPAPRSTIDYVRGVNSSFILRSLLMRGLVLREISPERKNVYDYRVSFDFLKHIGLNRIEDLPDYTKYKDVLKSFEAQQ